MNADAASDLLSGVRAALAAGNIEALTKVVLDLPDDAQQALRERIGDDAVRRLYGSIRRGNGTASRGRVVVINGAFGARLDVGSATKFENIWINLRQLTRGGFARLRLTGAENGADSGLQIRASGLLDDYLPLLMTLRNEWDVFPFAFDWRQDIWKSADQLAVAISEWAKGEPVHIVAHSMGGLVARALTQRHRALWQSMRDGEAMARGGRLVMLGTPNHGSYAAAMMLSGKEPMVQALSLVGSAVMSPADTLGIIRGFPGIYQMLPSSAGESADGREKLLLFDAASWSGPNMSPAFLQLGRSFRQAMTAVTDPDRLICIAGYDQRTPDALTIGSAGAFEYRFTTSGDGHVSHESSLLEGVRALWMREKHGTLPRNESFLDGVHELLATGSTTALESTRPTVRGESSDQVASEEEAAALLTEAPELLNELSARRGPEGAPDEPLATSTESLVLGSWVGAPVRGRPTRQKQPSADAATGDAPLACPLEIRVVWSDIQDVRDAQLYVCGHYENVPPQAAEYALDGVVSEESSTADEPRPTRLIHSLTKRGMIRGSVGDVYFFPWAPWAVAKRKWEPEVSGVTRHVGIVGMGAMGSFGLQEGRRLARSLVYALERLPKVTRLASVVIGAGQGNIQLPAAVEGYVRGIVESLLEEKVAEQYTLIIAERYVTRALRIQSALSALLQTYRDKKGSPRFVLRDIDLKASQGKVDDEDAVLLAIVQAVIQVRDDEAKGGTAGDLFPALRDVFGVEGLSGDARRALLHRFAARLSDNPGKWKKGDLLTANEDVLHSLEELEIRTHRAVAGPTDFPTRLAIVRERVLTARDESSGAAGANDAATRGASLTAITALTETTVVPKRYRALDWSLVVEASTKLHDPEPSEIEDLGATLGRMVLPREFREFIDGVKPLVIEVDRTTASVPWELMVAIPRAGEENQSLGLRRRLARQLRTEYSPPPSPPPPSKARLKALVVGDPGDPRRRHSLPGARREALAVRAVLTALNVDVVTMIGAPSAPRQAEEGSIRPASRFDVLAELMKGEYDILHYCGHGTFDPSDPTRSGWLFDEGHLLSSHELEQVDIAPRLVVANACLSALISSATESGAGVADGRRDTDLLPALVDEFFRRGVRNYIGTAWNISDYGAVVFSECFYQALLGPRSEKAQRTAGVAGLGASAADGTIGGALQTARLVMARQKAKYGALWAAYQHYGDPNATILNPAMVEGRQRVDGRR